MAPEVEEEASGMEDILQVFRIFKLARVLKLARHSPGELLTYFHVIINKFIPQIPFINSSSLYLHGDLNLKHFVIVIEVLFISEFKSLARKITQKQTIF